MKRCTKKNRPWPAGFQPRVDRVVKTAEERPTDTRAVVFHHLATDVDVEWWDARVLTRATWSEWMDPERGTIPYDPETGAEWK
jgi:hypothetical protein